MGLYPARCFVIALAGALLATGAFAQTPVTFQYFYDETGQLTKVIDSTGVVIEYVYDAVGNMLEIRRLGVTPGQLKILGLAPSQGGIGSNVEIQGQGFDPAPSGNIVRFNGTPTAVLSATSSRLSVRVPTGASTGQVTVSVGGDTAASPTPFIVLATPVITSITPKALDSFHPPASIRLNGLNLAGSSFSTLPAFAPAAIAVGVPQIDATGTSAILPVTVAASARGTFVLVASNNIGSSDPFPNSGNTLTVVNGQDEADRDGDGFPDGLELLYGSDPLDPSSVPNFSSLGDVSSRMLSVLSTALPAASQTLLSPIFSVVNTVTTSTTPQTILSAAFSVLNDALAIGQRQVQGAAFSILNSQSSAVTTASETPGIRRGTPQRTASGAQPLSVSLDIPGADERLIEGRTISIRAEVTSRESIANVQFSVNGQILGTDFTFPYELLFTVPSGVTGLTFGAITTDGDGNRAATRPIDVIVRPDPLTTITGRVVDTAGNPVQGAVVDLLSTGLEAEFFKFLQPLAVLPDLAGRTPDRVTRVTAINLRNPNGVFGTDPFGLQLSPDYAARFTGWITVSSAGIHRFFLGAHEGARLKIAGVTIVDMPTSAGVYQEGFGAINLVPGLVPIEITYFEGAGYPELQLSFSPPGGERQVLPPALLVPASQAFAARTDATGTFTLRGVRSALDVFQVRASLIVDGQNISTSSARVNAHQAGGVNVGEIVLTVPRR